MRNQAIAGLEQPKLDLVFIQLQKLKELLQNLGLRQKVGAIIGTKQQIGSLNLLKHRAYLLLNLRRNRRRRIAVQARQNMGGMFLVLRASQLLQDLADVVFVELRNV